MDPAGFDCIVPAQLTKRQGQPGFGVELDHVWWRTSAVGQTLDALDRAEWWNAHLDRVARAQEREFFEQVAHRCRLLGFIARAKPLDGLTAVLGFYFSTGHTPILHT